MAITVIRHGEHKSRPVRTLTGIIFGEPDSGKTTLALSSEAPCFISFEGSGDRAAAGALEEVFVGIRNGAFSLPDAWEDVLENMKAGTFKRISEECSTIVVDTVGAMLLCCTEWIKRTNPRLAKGSANMQLYGQLKSEFMKFHSHISSLGMDMVFVGHRKPDTENNLYGSVTRYVLEGAGSSTDFLTGIADSIGYLYRYKGKRMLTYDRVDLATVKNAGDFPRPIEVPNVESDAFVGFLAEIMDTERAKLATPKKARFRTGKKAKIKELKGLIDAAKTQEEFNDILNKIVASGLPAIHTQPMKPALVKNAKAHGFVYDKESGGFVEEAKEDKPEPEVKIEEPTQDLDALITALAELGYEGKDAFGKTMPTDIENLKELQDVPAIVLDAVKDWENVSKLLKARINE